MLGRSAGTDDITWLSFVTPLECTASGVYSPVLLLHKYFKVLTGRTFCSLENPLFTHELCFNWKENLACAKGYFCMGTNAQRVDQCNLKEDAEEH